MAKSKLEAELPSECAICLESLLQPCKLECGHVFCFLCIKGSLNQKNECALCRSKIKENYLEKPKLLNLKPKSNKSKSDDKLFYWFYKGRDGWWQYDDRTSLLIENEFQNNTKKFQLLIAGNLYNIDLDNNFQIRDDNPSRKREIKRDLKSSHVKGIAGILETSVKKRNTC